MTAVPRPSTLTARATPPPEPAAPLEQAALCGTCPKLCSTTCPVQAATGREAVAPWRISATVRTALASGWTLESATIAASCTGCGGCTSACLADVVLPAQSRAARAAAAAAGVLLPAAAALRGRIAATGRVTRLPVAASGAADAGTVLVGCPVLSSAGAVADAARRLAAAAGWPLRSPGGCCGAVALDLGLEPDARSLASALAGDLRSARRVVPLAPSCGRMIARDWPRYGLAAPAVVSPAAWLAELVPAVAGPGGFDERALGGGPGGVDEWALGGGPGGVDDPPARRDPEGFEERVTWHQPCTDPVPGAPVLRALGYAVDEAPRGCSGMGMAYALVDPAGAAAVAAARRSELSGRDDLPGRVVTGCPSAATAVGAADLLVVAAGRLGV